MRLLLPKIGLMVYKTPQDSFTMMSQIVMPNDTNPLNNLMGGVLMKWMDVAAGIAAARHSNAVCVTVSVDNVLFEEPIALGEVVTIVAQVTRAFHTSMEVYIQVFTEDPRKEVKVRSNEAYYTFVALSGVKGKPKKVPQIKPQSDEDKARYDGAMQRREVRLVMANKMKASEATSIKKMFTDQE